MLVSRTSGEVTIETFLTFADVPVVARFAALISENETFGSFKVKLDDKNDRAPIS